MNNQSKTVPRDWNDVTPISYEELLILHPVRNGMYIAEDELKSIQVVTPNSRGYNDFFFNNGTLYYCQSNTDWKGNAALLNAFQNQKVFSAFIGYKRDRASKDILSDLGLSRYAGKVYQLENLFISSHQHPYFLIQHVSSWNHIENFEQ